MTATMPHTPSSSRPPLPHPKVLPAGMCIPTDLALDSDSDCDVDADEATGASHAVPLDGRLDQMDFLLGPQPRTLSERSSDDLLLLSGLDYIPARDSDGATHAPIGRGGARGRPTSSGRGRSRSVTHRLDDQYVRYSCKSPAERGERGTRPWQQQKPALHAGSLPDAPPSLRVEQRAPPRPAQAKPPSPLARCNRNPECVRGFRHGGRGGLCSMRSDAPLKPPEESPTSSLEPARPAPSEAERDEAASDPDAAGARGVACTPAGVSSAPVAIPVVRMEFPALALAPKPLFYKLPPPPWRATPPPSCVAPTPLAALVLGAAAPPRPSDEPRCGSEMLPAVPGLALREASEASSSGAAPTAREPRACALHLSSGFEISTVTQCPRPRPRRCRSGQPRRAGSRRPVTPGAALQLTRVEGDRRIQLVARP